MVLALGLLGAAISLVNVARTPDPTPEEEEYERAWVEMWEDEFYRHEFIDHADEEDYY